MSLLTVLSSALADTTTEKSQSHCSYLLQFLQTNVNPEEQKLQQRLTLKQFRSANSETANMEVNLPFQEIIQGV